MAERQGRIKQTDLCNGGGFCLFLVLVLVLVLVLLLVLGLLGMKVKFEDEEENEDDDEKKTSRSNRARKAGIVERIEFDVAPGGKGGKASVK